MKNFWAIAIFVALIAILFTLNDGLFEKTKTFASNIWDSISMDAPEFDPAIPEDAEWKTYAFSPCGFSANLPTTFYVTEKNDCTGVLEEPQTILSGVATKVCKTLVEKKKDTTSCHIHTFEIANGTLDIVGDTTKPAQMDYLPGIKTVTENSDTVTIQITAASDRGKSFRYTHQAPLSKKDIALKNFDTVLSKYKLNN
jgi:hypothetical protein